MSISSSPRQVFYYCSGFVPRRLSSAVSQATLPRDVSTALRLLNMTKNFCVSAVNRLIRPFFVFYALPPFTPCHSERSRGISWKRILSSSPRRGCYYCSDFVPRGLSSAASQSTLPRDERAALCLLNMTESGAENLLIPVLRFLIVLAIC